MRVKYVVPSGSESLISWSGILSLGICRAGFSMTVDEIPE